MLFEAKFSNVDMSSCGRICYEAANLGSLVLRPLLPSIYPCSLALSLLGPIKTFLPFSHAKISRTTLETEAVSHDLHNSRSFYPEIHKEAPRDDLLRSFTQLATGTTNFD